MKWYVDGSGFNGSESKFCAANENGESFVQKFNSNRSNNEMEYEALLCALNKCSKGDLIYSDSQLVINQVLGNWKTKKNHLFPLMLRAHTLLVEKDVKLEYLQRDKNLAGNLLEK